MFGGFLREGAQRRGALDFHCATAVAAIAAASGGGGGSTGPFAIVVFGGHTVGGVRGNEDGAKGCDPLEHRIANDAARVIDTQASRMRKKKEKKQRH